MHEPEDTQLPDQSESSDCGASYSHSLWLTAAGLAMTLVVVSVFASTGALHGHFMADDFAYVTFGRALSPVPFLDSLQLYWLPMPKGVGLQFYRPTIGLAYAWDWGWTGWDAYGYRVTNLCLHIASAWLFLAITWRLTRSVWIAVLACWFFALCPAHPESLLWISSRVNLLATFFVLLAVYAHLQRRPTGSEIARPSAIGSTAASGSVLWLVVSFFAAALALTSKETGIILAPLLFVQVWLFPAAGVMTWRARTRAALVSTAYVWVLLIPYFALRYHVLGTLGGGYLGESERDYLSLEYALSRLELLRMLFSPVALTQWPVVLKYGLLLFHVTLLVFVAVAYRRGRLRAPIIFALAWLTLAMVPIYKAPFTEAMLKDSRLLYELSLPGMFLIAVGLTELSRVQYPILARALGVIAVFAFPLVLVGNMEPWLQMGRVSRALDHWARASVGEGDLDVWVADMPVVTDGAYLFLSSAPPFQMLDLDPQMQAKLHGVRTTDYKGLLREGSRRSLAGGLDTWNLMRVSSIDGRVEPETIDLAFPIVMGDAVIHWARASHGHVRAGDAVAVQLFVQRSEGSSTQLSASVELWLDGQRLADSLPWAVIEHDGPMELATSVQIPDQADGLSCDLRLKLKAQGLVREVSLGKLRVGLR